ncbi:hypothetical protein AB0G74_18400 [Streptomyces sp. NPDC020875]|uniref:hypothetical protein n=1 Tax=Streptomyces sp. NPDC020875 TaxID=3154898 RepID=UPI0033C13AE9
MRNIVKQTFVGLTAAASVVAFGPTASAATAPVDSGSVSPAAVDCSRGIGGGSEKYGWTECTGLGPTQRVRVEIWCDAAGRVFYGAWVHNSKRSVAYCPSLEVPSRVTTDFR